MLLRALFWISVVAILMPHEPDLGLGRPGLAPGLSGCSGRSTCAEVLGLLDHMQALAVRNLAEVKADIEHEDRTRVRID